MFECTTDFQKLKASNTMGISHDLEKVISIQPKICGWKEATQMKKIAVNISFFFNLTGVK